MDIKTELIYPLHELVKNENKLITVLSGTVENSIYQGILCSPPNLAIFHNLIEEMILISENNIPYDYQYFTRHFHKTLSEYLNKPLLKVGINNNETNSNGTSSYLFKEYCTKNPSDCYDGLDRHGYCCYVLDSEDKRKFKVRYSDFGKTW